MNDEFLPGLTNRTREEEAPARAPEAQTLGSSTIFRLCEEVINLRETNNRQHKMFDQSLAKARDELQRSFNSFAADTQRAYQTLRKEVEGERKFSLGLLMELMEINQDLLAIVAHRPALDDAEALKGWAEAIEVQSRKVQAALMRHGIKEYDAPVGTPYNPALHERVGPTKRVEGLGPNLIAEQLERGYASQQTDFVLRRPKVVVSE
jgi:molecular chaperone GrpE (heat shock protein)